MKLLKLYVAFVLLAGCAPSKQIIKFPTKSNDVYANNNLKEFLKYNKNPSIVLRVPTSDNKAASNITTNQDNSILYNAIERELLKQGYSVRDRGLFNELINKSGSTDYSKIKELTNTDLILEVVNIDSKVLYSTNKITKISSRKTVKEIGNVDYQRYGASIEFRLIMVKNNEIAGSYKYNYKPCPDGCEIESFKTNRRNNRQLPAREIKQIELRETISINTLEEFITRCTRDLIQSFHA